jgi:hypothetical protein
MKIKCLVLIEQLLEEALGTSLGKPHIFRRRVRKVLSSEVK